MAIEIDFLVTCEWKKRLHKSSHFSSFIYFQARLQYNRKKEKQISKFFHLKKINKKIEFVLYNDLISHYQKIMLSYELKTQTKSFV